MFKVGILFAQAGYRYEKSMGKANTRQLISETLTTMGVEYTVATDMGGSPFLVKYREETFIIYAFDDNVMIDIWDYNWYSVSAFDVEAVSKLQKSINEVNKWSAAKLVYNANDDDNISVSSKRSTIFSHQMKGLVPYLRSEMDGMLMLHGDLGKELGILKEEKEEKE